MNSIKSRTAEAGFTGQTARPARISAGEPSQNLPQGPLTPDAADRLAGRLSITSHSLTFSTDHFQLDYTWRNLDIEPAGVGPILPDAAQRETGRVAAPESRREVLRRAKLASLLDDEPMPAPGNPVVIPQAERISSAVRGKMIYRQAAAQNWD